MAGDFSYNIYLLGLKDPSARGRRRFGSTMEVLTGQPGEEFEDNFPAPTLPIFEAMDVEAAGNMADALGEAGILIEVRPTDQPPRAQREMAPTSRACPSCDSVQPVTNVECGSCGVVFKKYEREQLLKMQKDHTLEQAMIKAMQVREEWMHRAQQYLEQHKMAKDATAAFASELVQDEIPFLRMNSEEGPILFTSRRLITRREKAFESVPYEMVKEVDYGGGKLTLTGGKQRLQITFHAPLPQNSGEMAKNMAWNLDKESSFNKDVVFDWGYARNFICGACGERELEYRNEGPTVRFRCMHCATDHEVDLVEDVAVPLISD